MESPDELNPDPTAPTPGLRKRRRIPFASSNKVLSSDQIEAEAPETHVPDTEALEDDLVLSADLDMDQYNDEEALLASNRYLEDENDFDDDPKNGESRQFGDYSGEDDDLEAELGDEVGENEEGGDFLEDVDNF